MSDIENVDGLSAEEKSYFESRGEKAPEAVTSAEPEVSAEQGNEPADGQEGKEQGRKMVPVNALHEEREEKKELRRKLEEMERKQAVLDDRWQRILAASEQQPAPKAEQPQIPDPEQDIFAALKYEREQRMALEAKITGQEQQTAEQQQVAQMERQIWGKWESDGAQFNQSTPDFRDAALFLAEARDKQLASMAAVDPRLADKAYRDFVMNEELKQIVVGAGQHGISSAEQIYNIAKAWGYTGPKPKANDAAGIQKLADSVAAETSLSAAGGTRAGVPSTSEAVAAMSDSEFDAWFEKNGVKGFKQLMR